MPPRRRPPPAYPRPGTGEDFPARRPGSRIREDAQGRKIMQPTRATQARRSRAAREAPFSAQQLPPARPGRRGEPFQARTAPTWRGGRPTGRRRWPFSTGIRGPATRENPWPL